jgi:alkanesulfonate monooxygenase SsuD/methylene tetrahydromethanopterin reductase-like flavin-dependent oxidoreductase (luciferase family)
VKHKDEVLRRHCDEIGRDEAEIERTSGVGICIIRDSQAEAERVATATFAAQGGATPWRNQLVGTPERVAEMLRPYLGIGFRHLIVGFPHPFDAESMERLITEVKPMVEAG